MRSVLTLIFLLLAFTGFAQPDDSIANRIVLIGDAGELINGKQPVIDAVRSIIPMDKKTTVLFLGDNLYTVGLPDEQYSNYNAARSVLDTQASLVYNKPTKAYFIPGNHDWANGKPRGFESVIRQQVYIDQLSKDNVKFFPEDGCPGPVEVKISADVVLIIMDSQWWLNRGEKPGIESDCPYKNEDEVLTQLKDVIDKNPRKLILFACHHPFRSTGVHSGYYGIKQHIFPFTDLNRFAYIPLPLLGSVYPISRGVFGSPQDMKYPAYVNMVDKIEAVLKTHPYVIRVAGHEHTLQFQRDSNCNYIISGAGCKMARVAHSKKTKFAAQSLGFATLDVYKNKEVRVNFYEVPLSGDTVSKVFSDSVLDFSKFPAIAEDTVTVHDYVYKDSVTVPINAKYDDASGFKRFLLGDNYRREWATPVKMKVFDINKEKGGFKITGLGGGKQSRSLHMEDKTGRKWVLRSINKDPITAMPENFREGITADIVQDMISASHPYGALVVPGLSVPLEVAHATPEYFFVPDDYSFGYYRPVFANTVCMLEESHPSIDDTKTRSTFKVFNKMLENNKRTVDQQTMLRARMLDFLIADFDRHYDQWNWGEKDTGKGKVYYPVPKDRDQALFHTDGFMMKIVENQKMPFLKGLRSDIPSSNWLGYVARDFDRSYLNELDQHDWEVSLQSFKSHLSDEAIDKSVKNLPPEIYAINGTEIAAKLKSRRDLIPEKGLDYYKFISRHVNVLGSNQNEYFRVSGDDKTVTVKVYAREDNGDTSFLMYKRQFDPKVTKEIRLYGFNGDDIFKVDESVSSTIKLRIIGGKGNDTFDIKGRMRNYLYDLSTEINPVVSRRRTVEMFSADPKVNQYINHNSPEFNYPSLSFPKLELGYNAEDGPMFGVGVSYRTYGFRKDPYATDQHLSTIYSFSNKAYQVRYRGEFMHVIRNYDLTLAAIYKNPTLDNFFGYGNNREKVPDASLTYYRVRYKYIAGDVMLRARPVGRLLSISAGPAFYYYWNKYYNNADRILAHPSDVQLDSASIYSRKAYAGGKLAINVYNLNSELFPTRGINWTTTFSSMAGLNDNSHAITKLESHMAIYASLTDPAKVVAVVRLGGGHILSNNFEYFQALALGGDNYLRGFLKDRFSGSSMAYASLELRVKLLDVKSYVFPGSLGIIGFNDAGRVWMPNQTSNKIHDGYGTGLYYTPFNYAIISTTVAFSNEQTLFNFSVGAKINLLF